MTISFDQARQIVEDDQVGKPAAGTYFVAPWGWKDARSYLVVAGAHEWLIDGNDDFMPPLNGGVAILVDRSTGTVDRVSYIAEMDRIDAMAPVGTGHPETD